MVGVIFYLITFKLTKLRAGIFFVCNLELHCIYCIYYIYCNSDRQSFLKIGMDFSCIEGTLQYCKYVQLQKIYLFELEIWSRELFDKIILPCLATVILKCVPNDVICWRGIVIYLLKRCFVKAFFLMLKRCFVIYFWPLLFTSLQLGFNIIPV